jgi:hypothetical protein
MISGTMSLSKLNGELYEDYSGNNTTIILLSSSTNYFVKQGLFLGLGLNYASQVVGPESSKSMGIGPNVGYAFGNIDSKIYPYILGGVRYNKINQKSNPNSGTSSSDIELLGYNFIGGLGLIFKINKNLGLVTEIDISKYNIDSYDGLNLSFSAGFVGFIFIKKS